MSDLLETATAAIAALHDGTGKIYKSQGFDPKPGSIAETELATTNCRDLLVTAYAQGSMLIEVVADQATAFSKTLANPVQTIAPWTIARSVLESAALGSWLLDTSINGKTRVTRSFALRYEGLSQHKKYLNAEGEAEAAASVEDRINHVEAEAIKLGFDRVRDKSEERIGIAQRMPKATNLVGKVLGKAGTYRLLSAVVHGHSWAINSLGFQMVGDDRVPPGADRLAGTEVHLMQKGLNPTAVLFVTTEVVSSFAQIAWSKFRLFGWDRAAMEAVLEGVYDQLAFKKNANRFWRAE